MRHYKEKIIPASFTLERKEQVLDKRTCDLCQVKIDDRDYGDYDRAAIYCETGGNWPEGGEKRKEYFDICPDCFRKKIIPLMETIDEQN